MLRIERECREAWRISINWLDVFNNLSEKQKTSDTWQHASFYTNAISLFWRSEVIKPCNAYCLTAAQCCMSHWKNMLLLNAHIHPGLRDQCCFVSLFFHWCCYSLQMVCRCLSYHEARQPPDAYWICLFTNEVFMQM